MASVRYRGVEAFVTAVVAAGKAKTPSSADDEKTEIWPWRPELVHCRD
uniref:Uncharacterized protein n=1 Tax=Peronospora matthiolae TaxID=2874970 RepID=A0AAV1TTU5_9STRA